MDTQAKIYFERLLTHCVESKALGLHLSAGNPPILKTDSGLAPITNEPVLPNEKIKDFTSSFLDESGQAELAKNKEVTVVHSFKPQLRFKINIFYQKNNLSASFRFVPSEVKTLASLGLPAIERVIAPFKRGVIIISGPFGSGKSTITAAIIEAVNITSSKHIITLEKPIEFVFINKKALIEQRQVGQDVSSFKDGLDFLAEEEVDIVVLSEIDEPGAIRKALELAQSGRLVIFQVNADSSLKTIQNIVELFPQEETEVIKNLLSENLAAIINLHLFKKIGGGNIIAPEVLIASSAVRAIIREGNFFQLGNILQTGGAEGMVSLEKSVKELLQNNIISLEQAKK